MTITHHLACNTWWRVGDAKKNASGPSPHERAGQRQRRERLFVAEGKKENNGRGRRGWQQRWTENETIDQRSWSFLCFFLPSSMITPSSATTFLAWSRSFSSLYPSLTFHTPMAWMIMVSTFSGENLSLKREREMGKSNLDRGKRIIIREQRRDWMRKKHERNKNTEGKWKERSETKITDNQKN